MDKKIDVYDFDGTIYKGDSSIDFMFFALGKNKKIWTLFFKYVWFTVLYMLHRISSSTYKQIFFSFLTKLENVDDLVAEFWKKKQNKIASFFLKEVEKGNSIYVISASPTFLLKPFLSSFSNVSLIATEMDKKTGEIKGENCKGKEKIRRLNKEVGNASIHSFYTDSLHDLPLVKLAEHSFLVTNGVVEPFNEKVLLKRKENKKALGIFFFFLTLYLVLGTLLSYHYDFSKAFDVLFNADSPRVIGDMSDVFANHYRIKVHPLFVLITQPLVLLISGLTIDKTIAIIVLLSIVTATSVTLLYKFASLFVKEDKIKLPMVFLFGFAFSNMVFTAGIELYNIAALFLLALWYHIAKMMKKEKVEKKDLYLLIGFGILTASITITNYVIFLIGSFILWMSKKVSFKKLFLINLVTVLLVIGLSFFQNMVWQNTPVITDFKENYTEEDSYIEKSISMRQIKNVIKGDYIHALVASPLYLEKDQFIDFSKTSILSITLVALFYTVVLGFVIWQYKKHSWLTVGLLLSLLFNTALHIIYGNVCAFLYALHFLYLPFLLFFTHYKEPSKKIKKGLVILLTLLTTATALLNLYRFKQLLYLASTVLTPNYFVTYFSLFFLLLFILCIILLSYFFLFFILRCLKKIVMGNEKIKYGILMIILFALWSCLFIGIQAIPQHEKFLGVRVGTTSLSNVKVYEPNKDLKKAFPKEYASYLTYAKEYKSFIKKYEATIVHKFDDMQYYFFGLGNRTKLLFKEGKLINLEDNTVLKEWDTENYLVIPNLYSVILQTKDGKMIKIVEEETGIYVTENDKKTRLEGTETKLHLENFTKQKYAQVKKVLYSEILINIKNGEPLPNFLVYDSVWYRDAAMAAMVLKQTNNINLIQPFVDDVKEMYDKQNNGVEEADNLGELLYIVSASKKDKTTLVENIKKEASTLIHENKKGSYLNGSTDGGEHPLYQSLWYDLGMKAQKEKTTIKIKNVEDTYGSLAWWHKDVKKQWYGTNESADFPYLAYAQYHTIQMGKLTATSTLYPLSYESNGTEADYESLRVLNNSYVENKTSPTHLWTASEMLLFLLDETGNLKAL